MSKSVSSFFLALSYILFSATQSFAAEPQIWFGGILADSSHLFEAESPWQKSASHLSVFKIPIQFVLSGSDEQIRGMVSFLHERNIALAMEMGMLRADRGCGRGEGYMPKGTLKTCMTRLKNLGGDLNFVAADEVVYFGKYNDFVSSRLPPCHDSVEEIAKEVTETVNEIRQYFPAVKFGFIEPIGGQIDRLGKTVKVDQDAAISDYLKFADSYERLTNSKVSFFQADVAWRSRGWKPFLSKLKAGMQSRGIRFGIIVGGNPDFTDDVSWTEAGLRLLVDLYSNRAVSPGYVIIQSWQPNPTRYLPESQVGTGTWMLLKAEEIVVENARR